MSPPKWMFLVVSLAIALALYSPILSIINGKFDFWDIFLVVFGTAAALYHLGIFIVLECEERKKV